MMNTPRKRRRIKNEAAILDAAAELIVAKGLENVSLRDIAKHADYSPAALYRYFDSKAAILGAVQARENQQMLLLLDTASPDLSPSQRVLELCLLYINYCLTHPAFPRLLNALSSGRKSKDQPVPPSSPYIVFFDAVRNWVESESIPIDEDYGLEEITYAIWAQIHGMATLRLSQLSDFEADFNKVNRRSIEFYLNGLQR